MAIRVFVVDDNRLTRTAVKNVFSVASDLTVVGEASDSEQLYRDLPQSNADVLVLDINMPGKDGLEILKDLRSAGNEIPVVVLTLYPPERLKQAAMQSGATSYLSKDCNPQDLIEAVRNAVRA